YEVCRSIQVKNKIPDNNEFTVHHAVELGESFMEFIQNFPLVPHLESYFQGKFILNSFGGAINTRDSTSYAHRIHRDIRSFSGDLPLLLNTLIMLDDFTLDNGATYLMSGSHKHGEKPEEKEFYAKAERAIGKAGSILMFNSNVWHAAGVNKVDQPRRSMTPMFCKPFIKQQFDYPRSLGYDKMNVYSEQTLQILGYFARVPASLDEWYQPPEKRMYRPGQG
ncbi:MAG: phytanoyl-CoA dioxygenase family protein, partial [Bdellovibrionota bacterium]